MKITTAIQVATAQRLATHEAITKFDPGAVGPTAKQVRDVLEPTLTPASHASVANNASYQRYPRDRRALGNGTASAKIQGRAFDFVRRARSRTAAL